MDFESICGKIQAKNDDRTKRGTEMKLKTRLRVTFAAMIGLPLLLTVLAFVAIGFYLVNMDKGLGFREMDYSMMSESIEEFIYSNDQVYDYLK